MSEAACRARIASRVERARALAASDSAAVTSVAGRAASRGVLLPYSPASRKLPEFVLAGLRTARWPGRAQIVRLPQALPLIALPTCKGDTAPSAASGAATANGSDCTAAIAATAPLACAAEPLPFYSASESRLSASGLQGFVYADCAHTERSMRRAVDWFKARVAAAKAASKSAPTRASGAHRLVLVLNCPFEKDVLRMLLPLTTIPFHCCFVAGVGTSKPTRSTPQTADSIISDFSRRFGLTAGTASDATAPARSDAHTNGPGSVMCSAAASASVVTVATATEAAASASTRAGAVASVTASTDAATLPAALVGALGESDSTTRPSANADGQSAPQTWLHSLRDLWVAAHSHPDLQAQRRALAAPVQEYEFELCSGRGPSAVDAEPSHASGESGIAGPAAVSLDGCSAAAAGWGMKAAAAPAAVVNPQALAGDADRMDSDIPENAPPTSVVPAFIDALRCLVDEANHTSSAASGLSAIAIAAEEHAGATSYGGAAAAVGMTGVAWPGEPSSSMPTRLPSACASARATRTTASGPVHHILVTGNMYLVGEALHALGAL